MRYTHTEKQGHKQREKQAPCRKPDVGLDPRFPGSGPGLKAGAKLLSHSGIPFLLTLLRTCQHHLASELSPLCI